MPKTIIRRKDVRRDQKVAAPVTGLELARVILYCKDQGNILKPTDIVRQGLQLFFTSNNYPAVTAEKVISELGKEWAESHGIPVPNEKKEANGKSKKK